MITGTSQEGQQQQSQQNPPVHYQEPDIYLNLSAGISSLQFVNNEISGNTFCKERHTEFTQNKQEVSTDQDATLNNAGLTNFNYLPQFQQSHGHDHSNQESFSYLHNQRYKHHGEEVQEIHVSQDDINSVFQRATALSEKKIVILNTQASQQASSVSDLSELNVDVISTELEEKLATTTDSNIQKQPAAQVQQAANLTTNRSLRLEQSSKKISKKRAYSQPGLRKQKYDHTLIRDVQFKVNQWKQRTQQLKAAYRLLSKDKKKLEKNKKFRVIAALEMNIPPKTLDDYKRKLELARTLNIDLSDHLNDQLGYVYANILVPLQNKRKAQWQAQKNQFETDT